MSGSSPLAIAPKIGRLVRLMATDSDGEALGAVRALNRTLTGAGFDLHWLADKIEAGLEPIASSRASNRPKRERQSETSSITWDDMPPSARRGWLFLGMYSHELTTWERGFCQNLHARIREYPWTIASAKQIAVANRIFRTLWDAGERA